MPIKRAGRKKTKAPVCFKSIGAFFALTNFSGGIKAVKAVKGIKALKAAAVRKLRLNEIPSETE